MAHIWPEGETGMDNLVDYGSLLMLVAITGFLRSLHRDLRGLGRNLRSLSDGVARLESLIEGLRDSVTGRANQSVPR